MGITGEAEAVLFIIAGVEAGFGVIGGISVAVDVFGGYVNALSDLTQNYHNDGTLNNSKVSLRLSSRAFERITGV